jgi:hypothetical protein
MILTKSNPVCLSVTAQARLQNMTVFFWDKTLCKLVGRNRSFGENYRFHLQGPKVYNDSKPSFYFVLIYKPVVT